MNKLVIFNGNVEEKDFFEKGKKYSVKTETCHHGKIFYELEGIDGRFDSEMFDTVPVFIATAHSLPKVGEKFECIEIGQFDKKTKRVGLYGRHTTKVCSVTSLGNDVFQVITENSMYIVLVKP